MGQKRDVKKYCLALSTDISERLRVYAEEQGQTYTMAMQRLIDKGLREHERSRRRRTA